MKRNLLLALIFTVLAACAPPPSRNGSADSSPGTAGDPGGGGFGTSSEQQVKEAIEDAIWMFKSGRFTENDHLFRSVRTLTENFVTSTPDAIRDISIDLGSLPQEEHVKNLEKSKIFYDMTNCPGVSAHKHAAVSEHKLGANLCFNIKTIQEVPPSLLSREILALLVHEYLHLLGHREDKAQLMQKVIVDSWPKFEFFQHFKSQWEQVIVFSSALSALNSAGMAVKKQDHETVKKRLIFAHAKLDELVHQTRLLCSGFLIKVGQREKLLKVNEQIWLYRENLGKVVENIVTASTFNLPGLQKAFCGLSKLNLEYQQHIYRRDEFKKVFGDVEFGKTIRLDAVELAFKCSDLPKETFELDTPLRTESQ